jgi:S1-C subfamily serine protease
VVYSADGLILASRYVVTLDDKGKPFSSFKVILSDGETVTAKLVGEDKTTDVAVLRINKSGLLPVKLATGKAKVGEWIALVSNIGSTLNYFPASVVGTNISTELTGLTAVKPAKSLPLEPGSFMPEAFDEQGDLVGLMLDTTQGAKQGSTYTVGSFLLVPADKVAAAAAKLAGSIPSTTQYSTT